MLLSHKILIIAFIILLISIPLISFLIAQRQRADKQITTITEQNRTISTITTSEPTKPRPPQNPSSPSGQILPEIATSLSFGPTLNIRLKIEGRPVNRQAARVFVGISAGPPLPNPKYILSFNVDFPASGVFKGLSLAGLSVGSTYTALLKGPGQIATASAWVMKPNETFLNSDLPVLLLSGDLNEDNVINSADFSIAKNALRTTSTSSSWNERADFNLDGIINTLDISYIIKNFGRSGLSGVWYSPSASGSATPAGYLNL